MRSSIWIVSALAPFALAAPTYDGWAPAGLQDTEAMSSYFNILTQQIGRGKQLPSAPVCDLSKAVMPVAPIPLAAPEPGLILKHVAVGRGVQNYTCDLSNSTAVPAAVGAVATLYNVSCVAATNPQVLAILPNFALQYNLNTNRELPNPAGLLVSGVHFFTGPTVPFFNLDTSAQKLGTIPCAKNASSLAPADAPKGQGGQGNGAVAWLKLTARDGATGDLQEVYRLNTAGGNPPKTCTGSPAAFSVQYAAEYWFWESS